MAFKKIEVTAPDIEGRMQSRTLLQFRKAPVFNEVLSVFAGEVQKLVDAITASIVERGPADATGEQLDAIGRIVGQGRVLVNYDSIDWFTPDIAYRGPDQTPAWVTNAPIAGNYTATEADYRRLIEAKVTSNMTKYGSVPELQAMVKGAFNVDVGVIIVDVMTVKLVVPDSTSNNIIDLLSIKGDTNRADAIHFIPLPATVHVSQVVRFSDL